MSNSNLEKSIRTFGLTDYLTTHPCADEELPPDEIRRSLKVGQLVQLEFLGDELIWVEITEVLPEGKYRGELRNNGSFHWGDPVCFRWSHVVQIWTAEYAKVAKREVAENRRRYKAQAAIRREQLRRMSPEERARQIAFLDEATSEQHYITKRGVLRVKTPKSHGKKTECMTA